MIQRRAPALDDFQRFETLWEPRGGSHLNRHPNAMPIRIQLPWQVSGPLPPGHAIAIQTQSVFLARLALLCAFARNENHQPRTRRSQAQPNKNRNRINHFAPRAPASPPQPGYTRQ